MYLSCVEDEWCFFLFGNRFCDEFLFFFFFLLSLLYGLYNSDQLLESGRSGGVRYGGIFVLHVSKLNPSKIRFYFNGEIKIKRKTLCT